MSVLSWKYCVLALAADVLNEQRIHQYAGALTATPPARPHFAHMWFLVSQMASSTSLRLSIRLSLRVRSAMVSDSLLQAVNTFLRGYS